MNQPSSALGRLVDAIEAVKAVVASGLLQVAETHSHLENSRSLFRQSPYLLLQTYQVDGIARADSTVDISRLT